MCHRVAAGEFGSTGGQGKLATWVPRFCGDTEKVTRKSWLLWEVPEPQRMWWIGPGAFA